MDEAQAGDETTAEELLAPLQTYADAILEHARDSYGDEETPLLVDGIDPDTLEPSMHDIRHVKARELPDWKFHYDDWDDSETNPDAVLSNTVTQQPFFRLLDGLSTLTGDATYTDAAREIVEYFLNTHTDSNGLPYWGGHVAIDLRTNDPTWPQYKGFVHELKTDYPFYELMWEVDPSATRRLIRAFWNGCLLDWERVHFNRHADYDAPMGEVWDNKYRGAEVFYVADGYTLKNAGSDLYYAAGMLSKLGGEKQPLEWAKRLARQYVTTRQPGTGISGYQFNVSSGAVDPEEVGGDRAHLQFGQYIPEGHLVNSGTLFKPRPEIQRHNLLLGEQLGEAGREFSQWALEEMRAWGTVAYRSETNDFEPMLTDGHSLEGFTIREGGYFGREGRTIEAIPATPSFFWMYAQGYRVSGDEFLWEMARDIGRGNGLGDIGSPGTDDANLQSRGNDLTHKEVHGLLELFDATDQSAFLEAAVNASRDMLGEFNQDGLMVSEPDGHFVDGPIVTTGDPRPLVLLRTAGAVLGKESALPAFAGHRGREYTSGGAAYP